MATAHTHGAVRATCTKVFDTPSAETARASTGKPFVDCPPCTTSWLDNLIGRHVAMAPRNPPPRRFGPRKVPPPRSFAKQPRPRGSACCNEARNGDGYLLSPDPDPDPDPDPPLSFPSSPSEPRRRERLNLRRINDPPPGPPTRRRRALLIRAASVGYTARRHKSAVGFCRHRGKKPPRRRPPPPPPRQEVTLLTDATSRESCRHRGKKPPRC